MNFTIEDIKEYARGKCDGKRASQIREYLVMNPDLIIYVVIEKRRMAMEKLNITEDTTLPDSLGITVANAIPMTARKSVLDHLMSLFGKKDKNFNPLDVTGSALGSMGNEESKNSTNKTSTNKTNTHSSNSLSNNKSTNRTNQMNTTDNISITLQQLEQLREKALELKANADPSRSTLRNMVIALLAENPELSADKATEVARKPVEGITNFNDIYQTLQQEDEENLNETIYNNMISRIEGLTPEQQANVMINFMALVRSIDARNLSNELSQDEAQIVTDFNNFVEEAKSVNGAVITPEILEQLRQQLKETIEANTMALAGIEETTRLIEAAAGDERGTIDEILNDQFADADSKAYIALAAYMAALKGEMGLNEEVDPSLLGTCIAAGMERQQVVNQVAKGLISWETAAKVLKYIGKVLLVGIYWWFVANAALVFAAGITTIIYYFVTTASPVIFISIAIGCFFGYKGVKWLHNKVAAPIGQKMSETYDKIVNIILTGQLKTKVIEGIASLKESLKFVWEMIKMPITLLTNRSNNQTVTE